jgi:hypothetical protein
MKSILSFIAGAVLVGISSGVIAQDIDAFNNENGLWGSDCPVVYGLNKPCDRDVVIFMEENMLYN